MERLETLFTTQNKDINESLRMSQLEDTRYMKSDLAESKNTRKEDTAWQHMTEESGYQSHEERGPNRIPEILSVVPEPPLIPRMAS